MGVTGDHKGIKEVTGAYSRVQELLGITGWFYIFWYYSLLLCILFTKRFVFNFSVLLETVRLMVH